MSKSSLSFSIKRTAGKYDIPIAAVQITPIDASDVIRIDDFSEYMTENIIDINSAILSTVHSSSNYSTLDVVSVDTELMVTNKTFLDEKKGRVTPLWYLHTVSSAYYNKAYSSKTIKRRVRKDYIESDRIFTYLTDANNKAIVRDSISVSRIVTANTVPEELSRDTYVVDYASRKLSISRDKLFTDNAQTSAIFEVIVTYTVVNLDILITPVDKEAKYTVEIYQPVLSPGYFILEIFSTSSAPFNVVYKYADANSHIKEMNEYTAATRIFQKVTQPQFIQLCSGTKHDPVFERIFSVEELNLPGTIYNIHVGSKNLLESYYFTSDREHGSRIHIEHPFSRKYDTEWYLTVPPSKTVHTFESNNVATTVTFSFPSNEAILGITEKAMVVASNMIALNHKNPLISRTVSGAYSGISITRNKQQIDILYIDIEKGLVCLADDVSRKENIVVSYRIRRNGSEIRSMCFNPMPCHSHHNKSCKKMVYALYLVSDEFSPSTRIVVAELPKYVNARPINYDYDDLNKVINAADATTRNTIRSTISFPEDATVDFLSQVNLYPLIPVALVYLSNPLDENGFSINDVRTYGGGFITPKYSCHDYSLYDGEMVDLSAKLHYTVPRHIYTSLRSRALEYDENIAHLSDKESRVDGIVQEKLLAIFKKYSQLGTEISFEVVE